MHEGESGDGVVVGAARGVTVVGNLAYVSTSAADLVILDVSDPLHPTRLGQYAGRGSGGPVAVHGDRAYIAAGPAGLEIVDVSDPAQPRELGRFLPSDPPVERADPERLTGAMDVLIDGAYAFVAWADDGLYAVDVSDPATPLVVVNYLPLPLHNRGAVSVSTVSIADGMLLLSTRADGVEAVLVTELLTRREVDGPVSVVDRRVAFTHGSTQSTLVQGDRLYVAAAYGGLRIMDLHRVLGH